MSGNEIRNKNFLLFFKKVALSQKYGESEFWYSGKIMKKLLKKLFKNSNDKGFLHILREAEVHTILKTWGKWIPIVREKYGKMQTQTYGFLNISREIENYTSLKTWEKWIFISREKYEKTQTFQSYGLLMYFSGTKNLYNS